MTRLIKGDHDEQTIRQLDTCIKHGAEHAVLCADGHLGYAVPIGGVLAHPDGVFIQGVGYDIGCGNACLLTDATTGDIAPSIGPIMDSIYQTISFGIGRQNNTRVDHPIFDDDRWKLPAISGLKSLARDQLGTVGSGNHYIDIFADTSDRIWIGVHFGSRGFGHKTATYFMQQAGAKDGFHSPPTLLTSASSLGIDYMECAGLAQEYASAGRLWVIQRVLKILGAKAIDLIHNHHNAFWRERHFDQDYWVVRKGATPAFPGQLGFVGGSMGDDAVILEGIESEESKASLYSTVHGAGRVMGRRQAKKQIAREDMDRWIRDRDVELRGGDLDESPHAYRRLPEVLKYHEGTIRVLHVLRPIGVAMAGHDVVDPYKD